MTKTYNKLVRDNIPEVIIRKGQKPQTKLLSDEEYVICLRDKLQEEVAEFIADNNGEELADILEVLYALAETLNLSPSDIEALRVRKAIDRGGFRGKVYLISVED